jgi:glucokinase
MASEGRTRHLGLDLGATNVKWAVLERDDGDWSVLERGQFPTSAADGADAVIQRMAVQADRAREAWPDLATVGVGVPGLFEAEQGIATFLPNLPPDWERRPVAGPMRARLGLPVRLVNDARAFGLAEIGRWLGIGIGNLIVVLTPDRVVLGGGVAGAGDLLIEPIRAEVRRRVHVTDLDAVEIVTAELGTWAGAIGAGVNAAATAAAVPA